MERNMNNLYTAVKKYGNWWIGVGIRKQPVLFLLLRVRWIEP